MTVQPIKVEVENLSPIKRKLRIEVPSAEVAQEVDKAYRELGKQAKVKGFRPGKVPRTVLELYYRKQVEQEVSDTLVRRSLGEALKEKALEPVDLKWPEPPPQVVAGEDYRYSVELEITPEFTVEDYQGLALEAPEVEVTDEAVDQRLEEIRQMNAVLKPPAEPREIREGDFVVLDYQGYFAGQALKEAVEENKYMEVGSGRFNEKFEGQLLGLSPGAETRFTVEMPQDFYNPLLAGKVMEFQVKIHDLKEKSVPDLDDAFALALGGDFKTLADLRTVLREDIIKERERERQSRLETQALDQLLERTAFEAPPSMINQEQENILREQHEHLSRQGVNMESLNQGRMLQATRVAAERRVRMKLILERLATQEGITIDEIEMDAGLERVAARSGRDMAQVRQFYQENNLLEALRRQLQDEKTIKLVVDRAVITAPETPATEQT